MNTKHTLTTLRAEPTTDLQGEFAFQFVTGEGRDETFWAQTCGGLSPEEAAHFAVSVIHAVNSFEEREAELKRLKDSRDELLALAKRVKEWRQYWNERDQLSNHDDKIWEMADNAIAKAEGKV